VIPTAPCPGTSPDGSRPTFTVPQDDEYTLIAAATDPATNRDVDPLEVEFEVDATPPTTDLQSVDFGSGPTPLRRTQSRSITVGFTGADANTTRSSGVRLYQCRIDSDNPEAWRTCESPQRFGGLPDGSHKLEIRSLDFAGSPDGAPETVEWVVDRTPPVTTITQAPDPVTNDDQPSFEFTVNEAVDSSTCRLDSLPAVTCDSPVTLAELGAPGALADGPHEFTVSSVDIAGNQEMASASASWEQDTIAPEVELTEHPAAFVPAGPADFVWVVRDGAGMEISSEPLSECQLDAGPWAPCDREFSLTEVENSDGPHVFRVRATDAAGNTSSVVEKSWTVRAGAPPAPSISASQPEDGAVTRLTAASISFGHPDEDTGVLEGLFCQLDNGPFVPCEQNVMYDGLADGDHTFRVIATDIFGNTSPAAVLSWSVQSRAPVTSINSGPNGLTRQRNATVSFSSNRSSTFECRVDGGSWEACSSPLQLTNLVDGPHTVRVRAVSLVDPVGVKDPTPPLREWTVDATAPSATIDSAPSGSGPATSATVLFSSDDPGAAFQCRIGTAPFDACSSPLNLTNLRPGTVNLSVRAVDQAGNLSEPALASWTVDQPTCPPGFQGTPPDCVEIGPIEGPAITGKLREGSLSLAALGSVPLPADQITLSGVRAADGRWLVPKDGVEFLPVVQTIPDAIGPGQNVDVEISISATNDGLGTLPSGGGPATFVLPVKADVVAKLNGLTLPLGDECSLKPITFDLTGTYDEAGKSVTLSSPNVGFPTVTGCGTFKAIVDSLLELPRDDIAISLTFDLEQAAPSAPRLTKPRIKAPKSVKAGKPVTIRGRFTNTGGTDARGVKVCLKSPRAVVKGPGSRCRMVDVPAGASRTVSFKVTTKKGTKGKRARFTYSARYTASGAKVITRTGHVTLMK
jgi:hypothetical protein